MTDEKIKPVGRVARTFIGEQKARWYEKLPNGTYIYPESALAQAREEGRQAGMREASKDAERYRWLRSYRGILIDEVYMYGGNEELDREIDSGIKNGITRAAEGK
jgi:hypothetical protein